MSDNVCCSHLMILDCADTSNHKHLACDASLNDSPGIDNDVVVNWCLKEYKSCPKRPRGEDGENE